jgi:small GTP-binding protein
MDKAPIQIKIVLLGESGVGKSSIVLRYVTDSFKTDSDGTVGASYMGKIITINDSLVKLNIWDTAGQERYHSLAKMYYRDADAAILVYDITKQDSFTGMIRWYNEVKQHSSQGIAMAIVGNKDDLIEQEVVSIEEATKFAQSINAFYKKTSAKSSFGIEQLFKEIIEKLHPGLVNAEKRGSVKLEKENSLKIKKGGCC